MKDKKEYERSCFELFCELKFGRILAYEQLDPPHPDISTIIDGQNIGIELTTVYIDNIVGENESQAKKNESLQGKVCDYIRDQLTARLNFPIEVRIGFDNTLINGKDVIHIGNGILEILLPLFPDSLPNEEIILHITDPDQLQNPVYWISASYFPDFTYTVVSGTIAAFNKPLSPERIWAVIENKDNKIGKYKDLYDYQWLILCVEMGGQSSDFDLNGFSIESFPTSFHHIFLLQFRSRKHIVLK